MQENIKPIWFNKNQSIKIDVSKALYKIWVATPVHSEVSIHYAQALLKFQQQCMRNNIICSFSLLKSSLVTQGRNLCVANMLAAEDIKYTHLLFIDSDIDFDFETIWKMLQFDKDVIACPYPMKHINWDTIWKKIQEGKIKSKDDLMRAGYIYPIKAENHTGTHITFDKPGLMELSHVPTGCTLFKRDVFEKMIKHYPELKINQPTIVNGIAKEHPFMYNFFDTIHEPTTKKYFGEDFGFCKLWSEMGGKSYAYIADDISHVGEYQFRGKLMDYIDFEQPTKTIDEVKKIK